MTPAKPEVIAKEVQQHLAKQRAAREQAQRRLNVIDRKYTRYTEGRKPAT